MLTKLIRWIEALLVAALLGSSLTGCSVLQPVPPTPTATANALPAAPKAMPTATEVQPTATLPAPSPTLPPTEPPLHSETPTEAAPTALPPPTTRPLPTATTSLANQIVVYLVQSDISTPAKKDQDKKSIPTYGCSGDRLIPIGTGRPKTGNVEADVRTALSYLFGLHSQYVAGLYNPMFRSTFGVAQVSFKGSGIITVDLDGSYVRSGEKCDNRRVRDQVWTTVRQFSNYGVKTVQVYLKGNLLGDVLANDK